MAITTNTRRTLEKESTALAPKVSVYTPTNSARAFPFLHTLSSIYCL